MSMLNDTTTATVVAAAVTWLLTVLSKSKKTKELFVRIPRRWQAMLPLVIAAGVTALISQLRSGTSLGQAFWMAISAGVGAIGIHEVGVKGLANKSSASRPTPRPTPPPLPNG